MIFSYDSVIFTWFSTAIITTISPFFRSRNVYSIIIHFCWAPKSTRISIRYSRICTTLVFWPINRICPCFMAYTVFVVCSQTSWSWKKWKIYTSWVVCFFGTKVWWWYLYRPLALIYESGIIYDLDFYVPQTYKSRIKLCFVI